jgi:acetylornithine deacetylase/succinyl-diaminopimelate desuccinylase-like protein
MTSALDFARTHADRFESELEDWLRIPSISTDSAYKDDVRRAAEWLVENLKAIGIARAEIRSTNGHPIVYAEHIVDPDRPTVLVYGHYDVQPPDPLELWDSPPFEPVRKNGVLYARGSADDKGQLFMHVKAAEAYLNGGDPPVNLKFIIEGEEESGSANLVPYIEAHKEELAADVVLVSDTALFGPGIPSITSGLRGMSYCEITLTGPNRDLHSGVYGGAVENPINALSRLIAGLHDSQHRITVPGFYDDVRDMSDDERRAYRELPFDEATWGDSIGIDEARTEEGYSVLEATTARPTLDANGIWGGYTGEGAKTVLPSKASAKISMRLVPDQNPEDIAEKLKAYFEAHTPPTMKLTFTYLHGGHPSVVDTSSPAMQAALDALSAVFDREAHFAREGGSIPVVADFKRILGLDTVLMGFGLASDSIHSPNEHFELKRFHQGIEASIRFMDGFAKS